MTEGVPSGGRQRPIRVVLVEDHLAFAQALQAVFDLESDLEVVDVVARADAAEGVAERYRPDVAVIDLDLPGGSGHEAVVAMRRASPQTRFLALTALRDRVELGKVVEAGVSGMLHKSTDVPAIIDAVRRIAEGRNLLPPDVAASLLGDLRDARQQGWRANVTREELTGRELEVLAALTQGMSVHDIAEQLHISPDTVETHLKNARAKLGVSSRLEAVVEALRMGLVDPPDRLPGNG